MSLFQNSVLNKYLKGLEPEKIEKAYQTFTNHFHNTTIQENIRNSKEEQYQGEFLIDLFVNVLGYTKNPTPNFNLTTELKNIRGSKKTDGAILKGEKALAVIELKGTNTTDLSKVETQAFGYKNNQPGCNYVITANFEKLRFYIDNAVDFEEFNLFQLTKERFNLLWLCLSSEYLLKDIPKKIKDESLTQEENITKKLYKDYASFRNEIFESIQNENPQYDKLTLFKKTQKLLDRFLFIFFAEDRLLLPPNSIRAIVNQWTDLRDKYDEYFPLYDRFKKYFGYMNTGHKGQQHDIFAYNGGLFAPDDILDNIKINDELLHKHTVNLSNYDFESEVSVNILGHIFEHSLNDIDEIQSEIQGIATEQSKTKRKKDGVFYTPKYITKYIVDNTVGKLCEEKKTELNIQEAEYEKERKGRQKATLKKLTKKLDDYRNWLLQITICDPACGSGAFLNQALDFLIKEHQYIDELQAKLFGDAMVLSEVENSILENNLFGVDINDESVEIAKLSLWLRTAQKGRKLTSLNNNIKCGNSLIDDPTVEGDKAFNWQNEFKEVFAKGGFDVIIGNPPYGASLDNKDWLKVKFKKTSFGNIDSYKYFVQLGSELLILNGTLGYIMPDSYLEKEYFKDLRGFVSDNFLHVLNIKLGDDIFDDVNLPTAITLLYNKGKTVEKYSYKDISKSKLINKPFLLQNNENFIEDIPDYEKSFVALQSIISKKIKTKSLIQVYDQVMGVKVYQKGKGKPKQTNFEKENDVFVSNINDEKFNFPYISQGIGRYEYETKNEFISYGEWLAEPRKSEYFENPKVIIREIVNPRIYATYIDYPAVIKNIAAVIIEKDNDYPLLYFLALINSKLFTYYIDEQSPKSSNKSYPSFNSRLLKELPIIQCQKSIKEVLMELAKSILFQSENLKKRTSEVVLFLSSKFEISGHSKKLKNWHVLEFGDFLKELKKHKVQLSLSEEAEWMQYFNEQKEKVQTLKAAINETDNEIDQMVYQLYGLSEDEIKIVEEATT
tara:strand:- start:598 stop:3618 length:3021 start_codon:yes stop_codon:yes gene_type:complete